MKKRAIGKSNEVDTLRFAEDYLGVKLRLYQKMLLRIMMEVMNSDKSMRFYDGSGKSSAAITHIKIIKK